MLHIHREKDENVQSVVDKFANAKERRLLFKWRNNFSYFDQP